MTSPMVFDLPDEAASDAFGAALAGTVAAGFARPWPEGFDGWTIHLSGDLGTGKTTVVRALLRQLGVVGRIKSPTFSLVERYVVELPKSIESRQNLKLNCYHFDFYRFEDPREWLAAGFRDDFADAALRLVEWPERAIGNDGTTLPPPDLRLRLDPAGGGRSASATTHTARGDEWLAASPILVAGGSSRAP